MTDLRTAVLADLAAESEQLDSWVEVLGDKDWARITTPEGWTIAHQIAHLAWTDEASITAITDPDAFAEGLKIAAANPTGYVDDAANEGAKTPPTELLQKWRDGRDRLARELADVPDGEKIAWYGPPMSPTSMATARIMETWAHGHDVAGALDIVPPQTDRCKHVCHLGVRTRGFAYMVRGEQVPDVEIRVELRPPGSPSRPHRRAAGGTPGSGTELWTWGSPEAPQRVTGSGYDFALLATRRRHVDDVDVHAEGEDAAHWLTIVQAFAGLPGNDPQRQSEAAS